MTRERTGRRPTRRTSTHGFRRKMIGKVVSAKMNKTVVVEVVTHRRDPLYGKYVRSRSRYKAHDEKNQYQGRRPGRDPGAPPHQSATSASS